MENLKNETHVIIDLHVARKRTWKCSEQLAQSESIHFSRYFYNKGNRGRWWKEDFDWERTVLEVLKLSQSNDKYLYPWKVSLYFFKSLNVLQKGVCNLIYYILFQKKWIYEAKLVLHRHIHECKSLKHFWDSCPFSRDTKGNTRKRKERKQVGSTHNLSLCWLRQLLSLLSGSGVNSSDLWQHHPTCKQNASSFPGA